MCVHTTEWDAAPGPSQTSARPAIAALPALHHLLLHTPLHALGLRNPLAAALTLPRCCGLLSTSRYRLHSRSSPRLRGAPNPCYVSLLQHTLTERGRTGGSRGERGEDRRGRASAVPGTSKGGSGLVLPAPGVSDENADMRGGEGTRKCCQKSPQPGVHLRGDQLASEAPGGAAASGGAGIDPSRLPEPPRDRARGARAPVGGDAPVGARRLDRSLWDGGAEQGSGTSADLEDAAPVEDPGRSLPAGAPGAWRAARCGRPHRQSGLSPRFSALLRGTAPDGSAGLSACRASPDQAATAGPSCPASEAQTRHRGQRRPGAPAWAAPRTCQFAGERAEGSGSPRPFPFPSLRRTALFTPVRERRLSGAGLCGSPFAGRDSPGTGQTGLPAPARAPGAPAGPPGAARGRGTLGLRQSRLPGPSATAAPQRYRARDGVAPTTRKARPGARAAPGEPVAGDEARDERRQRSPSPRARLLRVDLGAGRAMARGEREDSAEPRLSPQDAPGRWNGPGAEARSAAPSGEGSETSRPRGRTTRRSRGGAGRGAQSLSAELPSKIHLRKMKAHANVWRLLACAFNHGPHRHRARPPSPPTHPPIHRPLFAGRFGGSGPVTGSVRLLGERDPRGPGAQPIRRTGRSPGGLRVVHGERGRAAESVTAVRSRRRLIPAAATPPRLRGSGPSAGSRRGLTRSRGLQSRSGQRPLPGWTAPLPPAPRALLAPADPGPAPPSPHEPRPCRRTPAGGRLRPTPRRTGQPGRGQQGRARPGRSLPTPVGCTRTRGSGSAPRGLHGFPARSSATNTAVCGAPRRVRTQRPAQHPRSHGGSGRYRGEPELRPAGLPASREQGMPTEPGLHTRDGSRGLCTGAGMLTPWHREFLLSSRPRPRAVPSPVRRFCHAHICRPTKEGSFPREPSAERPQRSPGLWHTHGCNGRDRGTGEGAGDALSQRSGTGRGGARAAPPGQRHRPPAPGGSALRKPPTTKPKGTGSRGRAAALPPRTAAGGDRPSRPLRSRSGDQSAVRYGAVPSARCPRTPAPHALTRVGDPARTELCGTAPGSAGPGTPRSLPGRRPREGPVALGPLRAGAGPLDALPGPLVGSSAATMRGRPATIPAALRPVPRPRRGWSRRHHPRDRPTSPPGPAAPRDGPTATCPRPSGGRALLPTPAGQEPGAAVGPVAGRGTERPGPCSTAILGGRARSAPQPATVPAPFAARCAGVHGARAPRAPPRFGGRGGPAGPGHYLTSMRRITAAQRYGAHQWSSNVSKFEEG
ncbi:collagen alpha-1(I) chain-like [Strigops habroptila]|uniref:collagen alpha-1(I) chain-like n=1 Tax=Strigops habroptila TaxID=2489341 RepID=UPI0011CFB73E|nr:collagen alpha-1(I) chain-like [Strigops habroptila]